MDRVVFKRTVYLPMFTMQMFTMQTGETWLAPRVRFRSDGSLHLGCGVAQPDSFEVVARSESYRCGRECSCRA